MSADFQPFSRDEPVSIGEALGGGLGATNLDAYIAEKEAEQRANPNNCHPLGVCKVCKTVLREKVIPAGVFGYLPNVICDACVDASHADYEAEENKARDAKLSGIIPIEFLNWDTAKGNNALMARVNGAFSYTNRMGFILHGSSGTCKTRMLWQLVKGIVAQPEGYTWAFVDAFECATKGFPAETERVDFLFIDDLGNEPTSTRYETSLLHLIRKRCDWHRPVFISTQLTGAQFKLRYFNGAAASAVLRRLNERGTPIQS